MSSSDQEHEAGPPQRAQVPGTVQAAAVLLYVGGALTASFALIGLASGGLGGVRGAVYVLLGGLYLGLARAVQRGRRWARRAVLVLCAAGAALAGILLFGAGLSAAVSELAWPVVYAILLNTETARAWFRPAAIGPAG